jgi:hypothetical protein
MRTIILMVLVALMSCNTTPGQKISNDKIPEQVMNAFKAKFPAAEKPSWEMEKEAVYEVSFKMDSSEYTAVFDKDGNWMETEVEIETATLPPAVMAAISGNYPGYDAREACRLEIPDKGALYEVELKKGKDVLDVQFTEQGEVISKAPANREDEDEEEEEEDD